MWMISELGKTVTFNVDLKTCSTIISGESRSSPTVHKGQGVGQGFVISEANRKSSKRQRKTGMVHALDQVWGDSASFITLQSNLPSDGYMKMNERLAKTYVM